MSTSYVFKKLNEVEILETVSDEAHVLVEEGGAIRRALKTEVGGAGGGLQYDAVISIAASPYMTPDFSTTDVSVDPTEILNIVNKMTNNETVNVIIKYAYSYGGNYYIVSTPSSLSCRSQGTTDSNDNTLSVAFILYNYYEDPYSVMIRFSAIDGTCIYTGYKTISIQ